MAEYTYGHNFSKSAFFDKNDNPENSDISESGRVHCTSSLNSQSSILTYLQRAEKRKEQIK